MTAKNIFETGKGMREVTMKYDRLVFFIRHDSAETWGLRYGLTLIIGHFESYGQHRSFRACSLLSQTLYY
jgi:hypothetical protein